MQVRLYYQIWTLRFINPIIRFAANSSSSAQEHKHPTSVGLFTIDLCCIVKHCLLLFLTLPVCVQSIRCLTLNLVKVMIKL